MQKPEFSNQNWDIERSAPRSLHIGLNKPETNLYNKDIEFSSPKCVKFNGTRGTNPLVPSYNLPHVEMRPITPPKFIKDQMMVTDIDGAQPRKHKHIGFATRASNKIDDIEGTKAKMRHSPRARSPGFNAYDYSDITKKDFVTRRSVNPLSPMYKARDENNNLVDIGPVEGSLPCALPKERTDQNFFGTSLKTLDILGAQ